MGVLYREGQGVDKNPEKALEYFTKAMDEGSFQAMVTLAALSYSGNGIPRDYDRAFRLLKRCSNFQSSCSKEVYAEITRNLSACYRFGRGTEANEELADYWMEISVQNGNSEASDVRSMFGITNHIL